MRQGTTPTVTLSIAGIDLTPYTVRASFGQGGADILDIEDVRMTKTYSDGATIITFVLTQAETLLFQYTSMVAVQIKAVYQSNVIASNIRLVSVYQIINTTPFEVTA
jgi:hypothetical protein